MTDAQRALFMAVEDVLQRHQSSFEDLCDTYAQAFEDDAAAVEHPVTKSCLLEAAASLRSAGMDWYVSTK